MTDDAAPVRPTRVARLMTVLRRRDWLGIAIELAVVVVGILIAFQIDQWGDEQEQAEQERQFLERLHVENRRAMGELEQVLPEHRKAYRELGAVLRAAGDDARLHGYASTPDFGCGIGNVPYAAFNDTASHEIVASGRLNLVSEPALRDQIREVVALQEQGSLRADNARQFRGIVYPATAPYFRFTMGQQPDATCTIDWPELMRDSSAKTTVYTSHRVQLTIMRARAATLDAQLRLDKALACRLGKPECQR